jgi:pimeloyl-ACP methyl ester carboxylesterase
MPLLHSIILGKGEPLLILHGLFGMSDNWKTLGMRFAEDYEVHLIDQRNHGRSFHAEDFSYELMVQDLLEYISHYQLDQVNIIGHSMGGKTAMLFAVNYPEKVRKIIIADISPKFYPVHHQLIVGALEALDFEKLSSRKEIDEVLQEYIEEQSIRQFIMKNIYRIERDRFAFRFNLKSISKNLDEVGKALPAEAIFNGDVLFLKGERSGYILKKDEALIKAHFPNSFIEIIPNAGHWLHAENPAVFYQKIMNFLGN